MTDWRCDGCGLTRLQSLTFPSLCCICVAEATINVPAVSAERQLEEADLTSSILDSDYVHFAPEDFKS